jgi:adenylosuccinate synthase
VEVPPDPVGILHPARSARSATASSIDPKVLTDEIDGLRAKGVDLSGLRVSANAHLIMPYHLLLDHAGEARLGKLQIGTTRRGIGPCYADKAARLGIRVQDLLDEKILKKKIVARSSPSACRCGRSSARRARPAVDDRDVPDLRAPARAVHRRHRAADLGRARPRRARVFEGAQATLLDIDHGTYPFVTSSNRSRRGLHGHRRGPKDIDEIWGVAKAYATRVGAGPFPTELDDELGEAIREAGGEYGTTTGRARRVGWIDLVALRYAARPEHAHRARDHQARRARRLRPLRVCTGYRGPGRRCSTTSRTTSRSCTGVRELRGAGRLGRGHRRAPLLRRAAAGDEGLPGVHRGLRRRPDRPPGTGPANEQVIWTEAGRRRRRSRPSPRAR